MLDLFASFGDKAFVVYMAGCFTAVVLAFRSTVGNRLLPQTYGAWLGAAFVVHHLLIPKAAQDWHYWWYLWNAGVAAFTVFMAHMAEDAYSRKPVTWLGWMTTLLCLIFALFSAYQHPLPGIIYFYIWHTCTASQVACMIIWSGPVVPLLEKVWKAITHRRNGSWMHCNRA